MGGGSSCPYLLTGLSSVGSLLTQQLFHMAAGTFIYRYNPAFSLHFDNCCWRNCCVPGLFFSRQQDTKVNKSVSDREEHTEVKASQQEKCTAESSEEGIGDTTWALRSESICPMASWVAPWKDDPWRNDMVKEHLQESVIPLHGRLRRLGWQGYSIISSMRDRDWKERWLQG